MRKFYYVDTCNRFGQMLLFTSKKKAKEWCKKATRWNNEEIEKNIFTTTQEWQGFYNIFPKSSIEVK